MQKSAFHMDGMQHMFGGVKARMPARRKIELGLIFKDMK
jgi:hypothetical protein